MPAMNEIVTGLIEHLESEAEERGYQRAKNDERSRAQYTEERVAAAKTLQFPCTFPFTIDHLGWLIAHTTLSRMDASRGTWHLNVPIDVGHWRIEGGDVSSNIGMETIERHHTLHATRVE